MKNLDELSKDICLIIDSLEYENKDEKILKAELLLNINRLLNSEEDYEKNIDTLRRGEYIESQEYYDNKTFNKIKSDIIYGISKINYRDQSMNIDKLELLINLNRFLNTQKEYYNNLRILNSISKNKHI